jgi:HSP20 family molecular chaperone IbpA
MSQVAIEKVDGKKASQPSLIDEMKTLSERIRQRAFERFERRGCSDGAALDDWLKAERDLLRIPESELIERGEKFEARVSAPGFDPGEMRVTALPDALIVKGYSTHKHDQGDGDVRFCEFDQKTLFRRFDLPEQIDVDRVTANLEKGVLQLTAIKAGQRAQTSQQSRHA